MQIKPPSRKHRVIARKKLIAAHWWLVEEKPRSVGRLSQQNKVNHKRKIAQGPSELVIIAMEGEKHESRRK